MGGEGLGPSLVEQGDVLDRRGQAARQDSVEWTPEASVSWVDGRAVFRTTRGISGVEEHLILSLTSKDFELKRLDSELLPSTMEVDWVRVWQRARS